MGNLKNVCFCNAKMSVTPASSKRCLKGRCLLFGGRDRAWRCRTFNNFKIYSYSRVPNPDQSRLPLCDKTLCKLKEKNVFDKVGYGLWGLEYPPSLSLSLARLNGDCLFWQDLVGCQIVNFSWCCLVSAFAYDWRQLRKSRILISSPYGTKSYHNMYVPLATELPTTDTTSPSSQITAVPTWKR